MNKLKKLTLEDTRAYFQLKANKLEKNISQKFKKMKKRDLEINLLMNINFIKDLFKRIFPTLPNVMNIMNGQNLMTRIRKSFVEL